MLRPALIAFAVGFSVSIARICRRCGWARGVFRRSPLKRGIKQRRQQRYSRRPGFMATALPLIIFALTALVAKWVGYVNKDSANALREKCFATFTRKPLLTNVNFTVDKGDIVTLMGPPAAGNPLCFRG